MINREGGGRGERKGNAIYFRYGYRKIRGGVSHNQPAIIHDGGNIGRTWLPGCIFLASPTCREVFTARWLVSSCDQRREKLPFRTFPNPKYARIRTKHPHFLRTLADLRDSPVRNPSGRTEWNTKNSEGKGRNSSIFKFCARYLGAFSEGFIFYNCIYNT